MLTLEVCKHSLFSVAAPSLPPFLPSSSRHWQQLSTELGVVVQPKASLTFSKCLEMGLQNHTETISKVAEVAGKEFSIEQVSS